MSESDVADIAKEAGISPNPESSFSRDLTEWTNLSAQVITEETMDSSIRPLQHLAEEGRNKTKT